VVISRYILQNVELVNSKGGEGMKYLYRPIKKPITVYLHKWFIIKIHLSIKIIGKTGKDHGLTKMVNSLVNFNVSQPVNNYAQLN
jgi:hypothetical protein